MPRKPAVTETELASRFALSVRQAVGAGVLTEPLPCADRVYRTSAPRGWQAAARHLAASGIGGMVIPLPYGLTWRHGRIRGGTLLDLSAKATSAVLGSDAAHAGDHGEHRTFGARDIVIRMFGAEAADDVWTLGSAARAMWDYIGDGQKDPYPMNRTRADAEDLIAKNGVCLIGSEATMMDPETDNEDEADPVGYHECTPGEYGDCALYDCSAYYYTMLSRIAEGEIITLRPRFEWLGNRWEIDGGAWRNGEQERLRETLKEVADCKPLRNAMVGAAMGSYRRLLVYVAGEKPGTAKSVYMKPGPGPYRRLGLLIVRTGYDLCREQSRLSNSVYSTVDSVCVPVGAEGPHLWKAYGFRTGIKHHGAVEIAGFGTWGFWRKGTFKPPLKETGEWLHQTDPYKAGYWEYAQVLPPEEPATYLYKEWL